MNTQDQNPNELKGICVEAGTDEEGQPRLIIHTTEEQLRNFSGNIVYAHVLVRIKEPTTPEQK